MTTEEIKKIDEKKPEIIGNFVPNFQGKSITKNPVQSKTQSTPPLKPVPSKEVQDVSKLMLNIKKERKLEGSKLIPLVVDIAKILGTKQPKSHGNIHTFEAPDITISYDDYGGNITVKKGKQVVFSVHLGEIEAFRPDVLYWIDNIKGIHSCEIVPRKVALQKASKKAEIKEFTDRWGILQ